ncbi:MAG: pirin family protein [Proteobacteria bacterium]|nr:pirin family protein [Pseudomonadota bacterium]
MSAPVSVPPDHASGPVLELGTARRSIVGNDLTVKRALPGKPRRMVGAWCFLDHAGPMDYTPDHGLTVGPHPHIGLQTFTWMIEGEVMHHDSLGNRQMIRPGQVNLMTAGRGISHAEVSPGGESGRIHAAQLWIALPDGERDREPAFQHCPDMPRVEQDGFDITVLVGSAFGQTAAPKVYTPLVGFDLESKTAARTMLALDPSFEHAVMPLEGSAIVGGQEVHDGELLYLGTGRGEIDIETTAAGRLLLIGGTPFGKDVLLWWNFVGRTMEDMTTATDDWNAGRRFGKVEGSGLPPLKAPDVSGLHLRA